MPFDPLNDFAPITQTVGVSSLISIHPSLPPRSVKELVALAKKQPGKLNFGTPGTGSIAHLAAELFLRTTGINMVHVPYKGGGPAVIDAMAGQIECLISLMSTAGPQVKAGKLRGLGVTSPARSAVAARRADGRGIRLSGIRSERLARAARSPRRRLPPIVDRIHKESVAVLNTAEVRKQLEDVGLDPAPSSPDAFQAYIKAEHAKWGKLIREAGIKAE